MQTCFKYTNCEYKYEYITRKHKYECKYWHRAMFSGMPKIDLNSCMHVWSSRQTVKMFMKSFYLFHLRSLPSVFPSLLHLKEDKYWNVTVGHLNVLALLVSFIWPRHNQPCIPAWPRPLHSLTSQWRRLKQTVKVTVISSAGLIRFIAGQILHANVNAREEICYR